MDMYGTITLSINLPLTWIRHGFMEPPHLDLPRPSPERLQRAPGAASLRGRDLQPPGAQGSGLAVVDVGAGWDELGCFNLLKHRKI